MSDELSFQSGSQLRVALRGPSVEDGKIELRRLIEFGDNLQKTIDRVAYSLERNTGEFRNPASIKTDTVLKLVRTLPGSFVMELEPAQLKERSLDITTNALANMVDGIASLEQNALEIPESYDQGVLSLIRDLGQLFKQGIEEIDFDLTTPTYSRHATYNYQSYTQVLALITAPEEKLSTVEGQLLMVNFKGDRGERFKCNIYDSNGRFVRCRFDEDVAADIRAAVRQLVRVAGIGTINPVTEEIEVLDIKQIVVLQGNDALALRRKLDAFARENDTEASFRRGWEQILRGQTHPISQLWEDLDAD